MLNKLFKYEIQATSRIFLPLYAVLLVFAVVNKLISIVSPSQVVAPKIISLIVYIIMLVGVFAITFIMIIQRFYKNLLTDEGYLMFTLPVKAWRHIICKLLIGMMWTLASVITALASILIIAYDKIFTEENMEVYRAGINAFFNFFGQASVFFILEMILGILVSMASSILILYAAMAIGHMFNRNRVLASFGAFIALNTVTQIIFSVITVIGGYITRISGLTIETGMNPPISFIHFLVWFIIIISGLMSAGYYMITNHILSRRLNLE